MRISTGPARSIRFPIIASVPRQFRRARRELFRASTSTLWSGLTTKIVHWVQLVSIESKNQTLRADIRVRNIVHKKATHPVHYNSDYRLPLERAAINNEYTIFITITNEILYVNSSATAVINITLLNVAYLIYYRLSCMRTHICTYGYRFEVKKCYSRSTKCK